MVKITSYCEIDNDRVLLNGKETDIPEMPESVWSSRIYKAIGMQYPKFFKMDNLCKFGTLAAEILFNDLGLDPDAPKKNWGIICQNSCSSLDTDRRYQTTIDNLDEYYPSPAVFVYTLANIVIGEIAIRNKIMGETSTFIAPEFDKDELLLLAENSMDNAPCIDHLLCGWINYEHDTCNVKMYIIEKQ